MAIVLGVAVPNGRTVPHGSCCGCHVGASTDQRNGPPIYGSSHVLMTSKARRSRRNCLATQAVSPEPSQKSSLLQQSPRPQNKCPRAQIHRFGIVASWSQEQNHVVVHKATGPSLRFEKYPLLKLVPLEWPLVLKRRRFF